MHWCVTADYQQIVNGNIANQIHGFTIDYGKFILNVIVLIKSVRNVQFVHLSISFYITPSAHLRKNFLLTCVKRNINFPTFKFDTILVHHSHQSSSVWNKSWRGFRITPLTRDLSLGLAHFQTRGEFASISIHLAQNTERCIAALSNNVIDPENSISLHRIGRVRYINILPWLRGLRDKLLFFVLFSLYSCLFWELRDKRN